MFKKYRHVLLLIFYLMLSALVGALYGKFAKPESVYWQLANINYKEILRSMILIFSTSILTNIVTVGLYLKFIKNKEVDRVRNFEIKAAITITSSCSLIFSLIINLTLSEFELILNVITFITLFIFAVNIFLNYVKSSSSNKS